MNAYVFDFGKPEDNVSLCVEVHAETEDGAVGAIKTCLDNRAPDGWDGPFVLSANDPDGKVQEFRFYLNLEPESITAATICDEWEVKPT